MGQGATLRAARNRRLPAAEREEEETVVRKRRRSLGVCAHGIARPQVRRKRTISFRVNEGHTERKGKPKRTPRS